MGYRSIFISNACQISVKNAQLIVKTETEHSVPMEDIRTLMIENRASSVSAYAITELSQNGVCVFFCDEKHLPCAFVQPFNQYLRRKNQLSLQLNLSKPKMKRLWQTIVKVKIQNQAQTLRLCRKNITDVNTMLVLAENVRSGDPDNLEGQAAAFYFRNMFGATFARSKENIFNMAMNYGYAIIRGFICRMISDYGFEPCIGLHHCNQVNQFNLADDLIEPFRPLVDLFVYNSIDPDEETLSTQEKAELCGLLNYEVLSGGERHSVAYAIERLVHSLERCYSEEEAESHLLLPSFEELTIHEYE